jgi:CRP/FNR family cyclic AMP-dependent transcriptional regulator
LKDPLELRRKFLIGSPDAAVLARLSLMIETHVTKSMIFTAEDGINVLQKIENDPPHVLLIDAKIPKKSGLDVVESILKKDVELPAIIILSEIPDSEHFVDEVAIGRVQFISPSETETNVHAAVVRALNWIGKGNDLEFSLKFLAAGDVLIRKGDKADAVYILRSGNMEALVHEGALEVVLGQIGPQEFVGEMAYITGEARSADVVAKTDCELVEIPIGHLDRLLFQKPAWAKALMKTLTKRIKLSNQQSLKP